jgi:hypothetical protein
VIVGLAGVSAGPAPPRVVGHWRLFDPWLSVTLMFHPLPRSVPVLSMSSEFESVMFEALPATKMPPPHPAAWFSAIVHELIWNVPKILIAPPNPGLPFALFPWKVEFSIVADVLKLQIRRPLTALSCCPRTWTGSP